MQLNTYVRPAQAGGDQFQANKNTDKPLIIMPREHRTGMRTKHAPNGDGQGIVGDVVDIRSNAVFIGALWMGKAVVDQLAPSVDPSGNAAFPVKFTWAAPANGGNAYIVVTPLEGAELAEAHAWAQGNSGRVEAEREERKTRAAQAPAPTAPALPNLGQALNMAAPAQTPAPAAQAPVAGLPAGVDPAALAAFLAAQQGQAVAQVAAQLPAPEVDAQTAAIQQMLNGINPPAAPQQ